uniref:Leucine-rich repeat-containing protein n=1 Tax=Panagrolaimus sp. ES5 TaxID=591445 RepID=A0AC34F1R1_9BILA
MVPGSVTFNSITNQVFEFNIATSKISSNNINFDLLIRVRCIKNTQVRGPISEEEILCYENFAKEIEAFSKNEPVKLLCDPKTGNVENVPTGSRYSQKVKCLLNAQKSSFKNVVKAKTLLFEKDDNKKAEGNEATKMKKSCSTGHNLDNQRSEHSCIQSDQLNKIDTLEEETDTVMEYSYSRNFEERRKSESKKIGRPKRYETKEECKKAKAKASKKYSLKKSREFDILKEEVIYLEIANRNLSKKVKDLTKEYIQHFPETEKKLIPNMLNEFSKNNCIDNLKNSTDSSNITNVNNLEADKIDRLQKDNVTSFQEKRKEQQRLAVQRVRERRKKEKKLLQARQELCVKEREELKKHIETIENLMNWMKKSTDFAKRPSHFFNNVKKNQEILPENKKSNNNEIKIDGTDQQSQSSCSKIISSNDCTDYLLNNVDSADHDAQLKVCPELIDNKDDNEFSQFKHSTDSCKLIVLLSKIMDETKNETNLKCDDNNKNDDEEKGLTITNSNILLHNNYANLSTLKLQSCNITYLNLGNNLFHKNDDRNLNEKLWKRLPPNISILNLSGNYLCNLPCLMKALKLSYLAVNNCNLSNICPFFMKSNSAATKKGFILEIQKNPSLKELPFIPEIFYKTRFTKADTLKNFSLSKINVITDNEDFISTSRLPKTNKTILHESKNCEDKNFCKCCGNCGQKTDEKMIEENMIMDFNLIINTSDVRTFGQNFANEKLEKIFKKRIEKIVKEMKHFYGPGKWKTKVKTRLCSDCFKKVKDDNAFEDSNIFEMNKKRKKNTVTNDECTIPTLIPQILPQIQYQQTQLQEYHFKNESFLSKTVLDFSYLKEKYANLQQSNADILNKVKLEKIDSEFDSFRLPESQNPTTENTIEFEYLYPNQNNNNQRQLKDNKDLNKK